MNTLLSSDLLLQLREFIAAQMGLYFPEEKQQELERGIRSLAREMQFQDAESCIQWVLSTPLSQKQVETLAAHLTVGETYFFRENKVFEFLQQRLLPELVASRRKSERRLRLWSAGCCTGEEPYSLAILLQEVIPDWRQWNLTILATDINRQFLQKAAQGIYGNWSFRHFPEWIKEKYFIPKENNRFEILPSVKQMVSFSYLNLAETNFPSLANNTNAIDLIFCRNVLMYFIPEKVKRVIQQLHYSLVEGGWLVVSSSELSSQLFPQFVTVTHPDVILYHKGDKPRETPELDFVWLREETTTAMPPVWDNAATPESRSFVPSESPESLPAWEEKIRQEEPPPVVEDLTSLYEQRKFREIEDLLLTRQSTSPLDANESVLLARIYANRGDLPQALEWCEAALARDRLHAGLYYLRATILQELGRIDDAVAALKQTLYLDPEFVLAYFTLGHLHQRQGKIKESRKQFENALALLTRYPPDHELSESEGMTARQLREMVQAALCLEEAS